MVPVCGCQLPLLLPSCLQRLLPCTQHLAQCAEVVVAHSQAALLLGMLLVRCPVPPGCEGTLQQ